MPQAIKIEGLSQAVGMLRAIAAEDGPKAAKSIVRKGTRKGGKVLLESARAMAPVKSGRLRDSLKIRSKSSKGRIGVSVGTRAKDFTGPTFYAGFVIWGHKAGPRSLGDQRKHVAGDDFITRAFERSGEDAAEVAAAAIVEGIEKAT